MNIFIQRITDTTTRKDLKEFANRIIEKWFRLPFSAHPEIVSCRILTITNSMGVIQRHGLVDVRPNDAALKIIKNLNGAYLNEKRVGVKQYDRIVKDSLN